jgi:hypothetical protein
MEINLDKQVKRFAATATLSARHAESPRRQILARPDYIGLARLSL